MLLRCFQTMLTSVQLAESITEYAAWASLILVSNLVYLINSIIHSFHVPTAFLIVIMFYFDLGDSDIIRSMPTE